VSHDNSAIAPQGPVLTALTWVTSHADPAFGRTKSSRGLAAAA
jgi:hypothetical protein